MKFTRTDFSVFLIFFFIEWPFIEYNTKKLHAIILKYNAQWVYLPSINYAWVKAESYLYIQRQFIYYFKYLDS